MKYIGSAISILLGYAELWFLGLGMTVSIFWLVGIAFIPACIWILHALMQNKGSYKILGIYHALAWIGISYLLVLQSPLTGLGIATHTLVAGVLLLEAHLSPARKS